MKNSHWTLPVLTYHHVGERRRGVEPTLTITPEQFDHQLNWLKSHGYTTISALHLHEVLKGRTVMPPQPVLLTFDDGYKDLCEFVFPALLARGFTATVLLVTGRLGEASSWDETAGWASLPLMSREDVRKWAEQGIDFGAHSRTHPSLTEISDEALVPELSGSAADLHQILQKEVICLAYPHGHHNAAVRSLTARYFGLAFSCEEGLNDSTVDHFRIRRTMVRPRDGMKAFAHRLSHGMSPFYDLHEWRARLRLRSRWKRVKGLLNVA